MAIEGLTLRPNMAVEGLIVLLPPQTAAVHLRHALRDDQERSLNPFGLHVKPSPAASAF
jgi:hypothetical protein